MVSCPEAAVAALAPRARRPSPAAPARQCDLAGLLTPSAVAVVGASADRGAPGYYATVNLIEYSNFSGTAYLVAGGDPKLFGRRTYQSLDAIADELDVVLVVGPRETVPETLRAAQGLGAKFSVVISGGVQETGDRRGNELDQELRALLRDGSMRIVGPNCPGLMVLHRPLGLTIQPGFKDIQHRGETGLVVQSGGIGSCLLQSSCAGRGDSHFFSPGNPRDLTVADFVDFLGDDDATSVIAVAAESIPNGAHFKLAAARAHDAGKPLVLLKSARSDAGRSAAASHTGAMVGSAAAVEAIADQVGAVLVHDVDELTSVAAYLSAGRRARSDRVLIYGCSGGAAVVAADALADHELGLSEVGAATAAALAPVTDPGTTPKNPIDIGLQAFADGSFELGLAAAAAEPDAGVLLVIFNSVYEDLTERWADACVRVSATTHLPIIPVWMTRSWSPAADLLEQGRLPPMRSVTQAALVASALVKASRPRRPAVAPGTTSGRGLLDDIPAGIVLEHDGKRLIRALGVRVTGERLVRSRGEALESAASIGYPVIAKVVSAAAIHRAGTGLVSGRIEDAAQLRDAWDVLARNAVGRLGVEETLEVVVSEFISGVEGQVGLVRDPEWGLFLSVGIGGNWIETIGDSALVALPSSLEEIRDAFAATKLADYLDRVGASRAAAEAFIDVAIAVSGIALSTDRILECDLNPVIIRRDEAVVVDALLVLGDAD